MFNGSKVLEQIRRGKNFIIDMDKKNYDHYREINGEYEKIGIISCRITSASGGVYGKDGNQDTDTLNTTPYLIASYNTDIRENDRLILGNKMWTVGSPSFPTPVGSEHGASCVQATLTYNGEDDAA